MPEKNSQRRLMAFGKWAMRLVVLALVVWGLNRTVARARHDFQATPFAWREMRVGWLGAAAVIYFTGILPAGWFWWQSLRAMGQAVHPGTALRAYIVGNMGKYVPGKALVVVLRSMLIRGPGVDVRLAIFSVFVETLTSMAVGACLGALILGLSYREHTQLRNAAMAAALLIGLPTLPPVFRQLLRLIRRHEHGAVLRQALRGITFRLLARGWCLLAAGWVLMGMSLAATLQALPESVLTQPLTAEDFPLLTACTALAVVAGFVSFLPGGIGAREVVVMQLLAPRYGDVAALASAGLLRVVWLISEATAAIILYLGAPRLRSTPALPVAGGSEQASGGNAD